MSDSGIHPLVYSKNVVEFVTVANEYCATIENVARHTPQENVSKLQKILPLLYLKAAVLPEVEPVMDEELEKFVSELDYSTLHQKWLQLLHRNDSYYEVFDPNIQFGEETVTASISENLVDIYQDLKDFITSYSIGNEEVMNDSLAECIFHFKEFWGQQLVNVLRAVHMLLVNNTDFSEEENDEPAPGKGNPKWLDNFWGTNEEDDLDV
ncbi:DUF5063 domain-containing protein [Maribellus luteus]|uniref:DUF5063 domain-containing protein n=1 Tax=Maribellus luteus TaxID=2305463 RepID=A0A399SNL9_9BACT|nr:DUF5063 domain-containing protein [Maribellus luteus]RIJ45596.1 DUF5063 domain-containing protein [Maribellus luteus]